MLNNRTSLSQAQSEVKAVDDTVAEGRGRPARGPSDGEVPRVQAVDRAFALWEAVVQSPTPLTAQELGAVCGINRSTAWRLLRTLEYHGVLERDPTTQRYEIGYAVMQAAGVAGHDALVRRVHPLLSDFGRRVGESVTLAVAERFSLLYVDQVDPPNGVAPSWRDKHIPLHATSGGKVYLAWLPSEERDSVLPRRLERYTDTTITDRPRLERELTEIREAGYALCVGEYEEFSNGVSAPVLDARDRPLAVVNVWGPSARLSREGLDPLGRETARTADEIAAALGLAGVAGRETGGVSDRSIVAVASP